jgi:hypothetical protein
MKKLFGMTMLAAVFSASTAFAFDLPPQPVKPEPEGPDVQFTQPARSLQLAFDLPAQPAKPEPEGPDVQYTQPAQSIQMLS